MKNFILLVGVFLASTTLFAQEITIETFDAASSVSSWTEAGDPNDEASIAWSETGGEAGTGALLLQGTNSDGVGGRGFVFEVVIPTLDFTGVTDVQLQFDMKIDGALVGTAVHLRTNLPGPGFQENFDIQNQGLNGSSFTNYSFDFASISGGASENFTVGFTLAVGAALDFGGTLIVDNIRLVDNSGGGATEPIVAAPVPTQDAADVISLFSNAYTDITVDTWRTAWSSATLEDVVIDGSDMKKYTSLDFVGIETTSSLVDASGMTHFSFDLWTPNSTQFSIKLVDFGADGAFGGGDDAEHQIDYAAPAQGEWVSYDIPLTAFTGLTTTSHIAQYIFVSQPTGTSTAFIDNVYFYNDVVAPPATEPIVAAPVPTQDAAEVISLFSNAYTDITVDTWRTAWSSATLEDVVIDGSDMKKYTSLDFVGIETTSSLVDASGMTHFSFDLWTPNSTQFSIKLVDFGADGAFGGGDDAEHQIDYAAPAQGEWVSYDIPLTAFTGLTTTSHIAQYIFVSQPTGTSTAFIDNVYFYNDVVAPPATEPIVAAPVPTQDAADVISLFSNAYTDVTVDTWRTAWSSATLEDVVIDGSDMKKYTSLDFVGIETTSSLVDASGMTHFSFDLWTPNSTQFSIKLVDFGADGAFGGGDDAEHQIDYAAPAQGEWVSYDIPLTAFTGLTTTSHIAQYIFVSQPTGTSTAFIDNVYFYNDVVAPPATEPIVAAPVPTQDAADVISLFSNAYTDVTVDTWRTAWSSATLEDVVIDGSDMKKYTSLDFVGIETTSSLVDASGMTHFSFDLWTPNSTQFSIKLVDFGADGAFGGGDDAEHQIDYAAPAQGEWVSYDIPLTAFTGLTTTSHIAQYIFVSQPTGTSTAFIDNVYFYNDVVAPPATEPIVAAPVPTQDAADVISLFSNAYTDVTVDTWRTAWSSATLEDVVIDGSDMKKYTSLDFVGIETTSSLVDASGMTHFSFDLWTPNSTQFSIKLVDFGADGAFGGGDDAEHQIDYAAPAQGEWVSYDIPLTAFTGLTTTSHIAQYIFVSQPTGTSTAFIDNVYFYNDVVAPPATEPIVAAPVPTQDAADVISLFSNAYTDVTVDTWRTAWSSATLEDVVIDGSDMKKYTSLDFVGIETTSSLVDASGMTHFSFDLWTPNSTQFSIKLVDFGADGAFGGGDDAEHQIDYAAPAQGEWVSYDIPLTAFTGLTTTSHIAQYIFVSQPTGTSTAFIDNVYFYNDVVAPPATEPIVAAPVPTQNSANVISLFSDNYTNVTVDTWRTEWSAATLTDVVIDGSAMKKYSALNFVGVETVANQVDASNMTHFSFDIWSPDVTLFKVKLVDFGSDGAFGGGDDVEHELVYNAPAQAEWVSYDIPLSEFTGLTTRSNIAQYIFVGEPTGATTVFIDNVYFYNENEVVNCDSGLTGNTPGADYVLVWADEFDADGAVCSENWHHQTQLPAGGSWFNGELQHYTDRLDNSFVADGNLNIVAKKESFLDQGETKEYTSARLNSKFAFTYGRVDVRAILPSGAGTWPAIWTLGRNINEPGGYWHDEFGELAWPAPGEIDIMEHWGNNPNVIHGSIHTPSSFGGTVNTGTTTIADVSTSYHVYSMIWDAEKIQFLVDDVVFYTYNPEVKNADTWPFDSPQYLLLNIAMGGTGGTIDPAFTESAMVIDYVRVYQIDPDFDADLSNLSVDGNTVNGFNPDKLTYTVEIPADAPALPVVTATANNALASVVITDATAVPGTAEVEVTSVNEQVTKTYTINFVVEGTDATLSDLQIEGTTVEGFDPAVLAYTFEVAPESTAVPVVTATANSDLADVNIVAATAVPGVTEVVVTSEDGSVINTYTVTFTKTGIDATLSDLKVNGTTVDGFDPATLDYSITLTSGTITVPVVTVTTADEAASAEITAATALPGTTTVVVTSANTLETATYTVNFLVDLTQDQEIIFDEIPNVSLADEVITVAVEATSGLPVALSSTSDKIAIDGLNVTLLNAGRVEISASQAGNEVFNPATSMSQSFCINPVKPVITVDVNDNETIILTSSSAAGNQWYVNGTVIQNATSQVLSTTDIGNYTVRVRVDDCTSPFSDELSLVVTGLGELAKGVVVFPNPAKNTVSLAGISEEIVDYQMFSVTGKVHDIQLVKEEGNYTANISALNEGVYILVVKVKSETLKFRIIKE